MITKPCLAILIDANSTVSSCESGRTGTCQCGRDNKEFKVLNACTGNKVGDGDFRYAEHVFSVFITSEIGLFRELSDGVSLHS